MHLFDLVTELEMEAPAANAVAPIYPGGSIAVAEPFYTYIFGSRKAEMQELLHLPPGPLREERRARLHRWQDMYLRYRQAWQGMAFFTLHPA